jgi:hypothetical protein
MGLGIIGSAMPPKSCRWLEHCAADIAAARPNSLQPVMGMGIPAAAHGVDTDSRRNVRVPWLRRWSFKAACTIDQLLP